MHYRLRPEVLDKARANTGAESDEQLRQNYLRKTGSTVRNLRSGKTVPDVAGLMKLHKLTGIAMEDILFEIDKQTVAA